MKLSEIRINPKNPRFIRNEMFQKLLESLKTFPKMMELRPIIVDEENVIQGGNMRYRALKELGYKDIPESWVKKGKDLTPEQWREFVVKDNLAYGEWDMDLLSAEYNMEELQGWGFDMPDLLTDKDIDEERRQQEEEMLVRDLRKEWVIPPMSIFDARNGEWQERKSKWRSLVNNKTISESREATLYKSPELQYPELYIKSKYEREKLGISFTEYIERYATEEELKLEGAFAQGTSLFDPVLAEVIMKWFAPKGGKILDPFGGEPTKGIVAGVLGFLYTGVELRDEQVQTNRKACSNYPNVQYFTGDSNNIDKIVQDSKFDLIFTSPPYYDLEVYSKEDMSALKKYEEFMASYKNIFKKCVDKMAKNSFLVVKIGEIRDKKTGIYRNFVGDSITIFKELGLQYYNEIILVQPIGTAALRTGTAMNYRKVQHVHQNIIVFKKQLKQQVKKQHENIVVFYKGDAKEIKNNLPQELNYPELEDQIKNYGNN